MVVEVVDEVVGEVHRHRSRFNTGMAQFILTGKG